MREHHKIKCFLTAIVILAILIDSLEGYFVPVELMELRGLSKGPPFMRSEVRDWSLRRRKAKGKEKKEKKEKGRQGSDPSATNYCLVFTAGKECNGIGYLLRQRLERIEPSPNNSSVASLLNMFVGNSTDIQANL